ncbi:MAG: cyclic pyranopterin monophosphate synthase MoaC [Candidatus Aureabacteria bacterium]|nr:cyclic pyranopterin monophosphate synthase MoaC [Candidatus Auribacterota bacterium]
MGRTLSHVDLKGDVRMVDVSHKADTIREAIARGAVTLSPRTISLISRGRITKGNVLTTARLAGIMAAKRVGDLIPLCHPLNVSHVRVEFALKRRGRRARIDIQSTARFVGKTGVEIEALTAVAVAALTIYDMCKAVDRTMRITSVRLVKKFKNPVAHD